jgi:tetratricopeptide (TPR) repeat protein
MQPTLDKLISEAKDLANSGERQEALSLANELIEHYPREARVWSLRAYIYGLTANYEAVFADLSHAIKINPMEPDFFFHRGRYGLITGQNQAAFDDLTKGIELCDYYKNEYYRETLLFMRAEALVHLNRKDEALSDLALVRDDFTIWTSRLRTKAELVAECRR